MSTLHPIGDFNVFDPDSFYVQPRIDLSGNKQFEDLAKRVEEVEKRLCILFPNGKLHEKYPALKEAYENYKIIEKLVEGGNG